MKNFLLTSGKKPSNEPDFRHAGNTFVRLGTVPLVLEIYFRWRIQLFLRRENANRTDQTVTSNILRNIHWAHHFQLVSFQWAGEHCMFIFSTNSHQNTCLISERPSWIEKITMSTLIQSDSPVIIFLKSVSEFPISHMSSTIIIFHLLIKVLSKRRLYHLFTKRFESDGRIFFKVVRGNATVKKLKKYHFIHVCTWSVFLELCVVTD